MTKTIKTKKTMKTGKHDYETINQIVLRALAMCAKHGVSYDRMTAFMDISVVHESAPLRLSELLDADEMNFAHDIYGIRANMNRETGKLENCFSPRYTR